jgi:hypothetical protein
MPDRLIALYGPWGEHPRHPVDHWKYEVINGDTRLGYWAWVAAREENGTPDLKSTLN